ncbi:MAG: DUF4252 domain-containing protein [Pseudomonadota bacterium]|nr:DUF4252 domain-containing protein [Pseudomonadota bacterium]
MNRHLNKALIFTLLSLGLPAAFAGEPQDNPGYLDLERLVGIAGRQPSVEVTLSGPVLKMLLQLPVHYDDDDAARAVELLKVVDHILVRVFPLDSGRTDDMLAFINETSATLEADQWTRIVRVREDEDSNVDIHVKLSPDGENLNGLTVMAVEDDGRDPEVVFVNIVGNFNPAYLANIGEQFDLDYLDGVDVP